MKVLLTFVIFFQVFFCFGQNYIGKWTYQNRAHKKVIIEFTNDLEYKVTVQNQSFHPVERIDEMYKDTKLKYRIIGKKSPLKIDIISDYSNMTIRGIIELVDDNTIQLQINSNSCGERPQKFDPTSRNYIKAIRIKKDGELN